MLHILIHEHNHEPVCYAIAGPEDLTLEEAMKAHGLQMTDEDRESFTLVQVAVIAGMYPSTPQANPKWRPERKATEGGDEKDDVTPTVGDLADKAEVAIRLFTDARNEGRIYDYDVSDLICDQLHFCNKVGFDIGKVVDRAVRHFEEETDRS